MTVLVSGAGGSREPVAADPIVEAEGWAKARRWAVGGLELVGVGLLVPVAILALGIPIALVARVLLGLVGLL